MKLKRATIFPGSLGHFAPDHRLIWFLPFSALICLLFFSLGDVTGLQRDEAVSGLVALNILNGGELPTTGAFNEYTAPIHYYLAALGIFLFGKSVWTLRFIGIIFNILAALALVDTIRRFSYRTALYSFWFLATFPFIVISSRVAVELNALSPFFLFGGIWCFVALGSSKSGIISFVGHLLTGICFALGVWNHVILMPVVVSVILIFLAWNKPGYHDLKKIMPGFLTGGLIAAVPRLYMILVHGSAWIPETPPTSMAPVVSSILNIIYTVGGDALYARCCGQTIVSVNWFLPFCFLASIGVLFAPKVPQEYRHIWLLAAMCVILGLVGTWLAVPDNRLGSRIWLLPLWFAPLLLGSAVAAIHRKITRILVTILVVATNLSLIGTNYFYSFLRTGGIPKGSVYVGGRYDESLDALRKQPTIESIVHYNDKPFYFQDAKPWTAMFLAPYSQIGRARSFEDLTSPDKIIEPGSLVALCRTPAIQSSRVVYYGNRRLELHSQLSNSTYLVYEYVGDEITKSARH